MFNVFKRKPDRKVFGFLCDRDLSTRVKELSALLEVPIYCLCEHLMQLGLAHLGLQMSEGQENLEQVKSDMQDHLTDHHLLVRRLGVEQYEKELVSKHTEMTPEQKETVTDVAELLFRLGDRGLQPRLAIRIVENMARCLGK